MIGKSCKKKDVLISLILVLNVSFITIPYTLKNTKLEKDIADIIYEISEKNKENVEKTQDFHLYFREFSEICEKIQIKDIEINSEFSGEDFVLSVSGYFNKNSFYNLMENVQKNLEDIDVLDLEVYFDEEKRSEILFTIR